MNREITITNIGSKIMDYKLDTDDSNFVEIRKLIQKYGEQKYEKGRDDEHRSMMTGGD